MADNVKVKIDGDTSGFESALSGIGKTAKIGLAAVGTAVAAVTAAFTSATKATAAYGDNVDKMSQKIGISADAFQQWDFVLSQNGMSIDSLQMGMKTDLRDVKDDIRNHGERLVTVEQQIKVLNNAVFKEG